LGLGSSHAVLWRDTQVIDLSTIGGSFSMATAISQNGKIAGWSTTSGDLSKHATLWTVK
jgi:probable HAF family extracellular repeat protein